MPTISFDGLLIVAAAALAAPLALGLFPRVRLPAIVLEIALGIVIGPQVLGWVSIDTPIQVMSLLGLAFLLLLAGLEVEYERFRGALLFGQLVVAGASIAEIATIVLLSLFFSGEAGGIGVKLVLLGLFALFAIAVGLVVLGAEQSMRISATLLRLQDTTAEIRIRASFLLLALFVVLAERLGLEAILGAFLAGAILRLVDRDQMMTHPQFRQKLEAVGYGVFVPIFFVAIQRARRSIGFSRLAQGKDVP
jgi:Kef-type K+ transport system membrane component KefB